MTLRLIATDVDGTLITSERVISPRTLAAFEAAHAAGIILLPISGRQPFYINDAVGGTVLEGPVVGANGAVGMDLRTDEIYFEDLLPVDEQTRLVTQMQRRIPGTRAVSVRDAGKTFVPERGYVGLMDPGDHGKSDLALPEYDLDEVLGTPSLKLILRHPEIHEDVLLAAALELDVPGCHVTTSGAPFIEVSAEGVTKESGLQQMCARFGVRPEEVLAFGDNRNDVEMLRWSGWGVAVANALPETLAAADEVTASHDEDGLAIVIERFLQQREV
ncbi:HAD hydrolase family protein [Nigerium massiliense]|uniref:HAD hydrolase family protein n=1 Tax=Nigerium massiliense TaxID=1522317 RepID=UPI00058D3128|nr:HAD family hydrolase [Nigerium massiliense]